MRIATWNLQSDRPLPQEREALFRQEMNTVDADVWVLTETWMNFSPGEGYRLAAESSLADDLKTWPDRRWVAIWVKSSHDAERQEVQSQPDRMACARIKKPGQQDIVVIGTVLPWRGDKLWPGSDGFCAALDAQVAEWGRVRGVPDACTFLVAGDFNQSLPHHQWYGFKKGEIALNDALKKHDLLCLTLGKVPLTDQPRIDHLCISRSSLNPQFVPQISGWPIPFVKEKPITDHSGVFADLDLLDFS
jgi:hypothetical protein